MTHDTDAAYIREKAAYLLNLSREAQRCLRTAQDQIGSAGRWGIWDALGGGLISGLMKHSRIDGAMREIEQARPLLEELKAELSSIRLNADLERGFGDFAIFADFVFDGLFSDLYVQSKIRRLERDLADTIGQLHRVDDALRRLDSYGAETSGG